MYVCVPVRGGHRLTLGVVPWELSTVVFETSFLIVTHSSSLWLGWLLSLLRFSCLCLLLAEIRVGHPTWVGWVLGIELRPSHLCGRHSTDFTVSLVPKLYIFEVNIFNLFHHRLEFLS